MVVTFPAIPLLRRSQGISGVVLVLSLTSCAPQTPVQDSAVVVRQVTGPIETNAYLLYDTIGREAALLDVGGPVDSLLTVIDEEGLNVKYLLTTHGHPDHVQGLKEIRDRYPEARWGISRAEFEDFGHYARLEEFLPAEDVEELKAAARQDPALADMLAFDFAPLGFPDLFLEDEQVLRLGNLEIHTFLSPGHSRGSICFYAGHALFTGDVLFQGNVGRTDLPNSGGFEAITASVGRLYEVLPEETIVYPGHGDVTDIGTEKRHNQRIRGESGRPG
jgi:glyoxylase-like metal-dependent hydrolase (beta-lactamase superfamily II)